MAVHWKPKGQKDKERKANLSVFAAAAKERKEREQAGRDSLRARHEMLDRKVVVIPIPSAQDEQAYQAYERRLAAFKSAVELGGRKFDYIEEPSSDRYPHGRWIFTVQHKAAGAA